MSLTYIDTDKLERLSKKAVDIIYSEVEAKLNKHLETYKKHFEQNQHYSPWLAAEIRRYKVIVTHISFLRRNRAYWKKVMEYLKEDL